MCDYQPVLISHTAETETVAGFRGNRLQTLADLAGIREGYAVICPLLGSRHGMREDLQSSGAIKRETTCLTNRSLG
jgi:hypothetical protein